MEGHFWAYPIGRGGIQFFLQPWYTMASGAVPLPNVPTGYLVNPIYDIIVDILDKHPYGASAVFTDFVSKNVFGFPKHYKKIHDLFTNICEYKRKDNRPAMIALIHELTQALVLFAIEHKEQTRATAPAYIEGLIKASRDKLIAKGGKRSRKSRSKGKRKATRRRRA